MNDITEKNNSLPTAKVIYILIIVSTITIFTGIIGLIMAYVFKDDCSDWLQTHYRFQIRTCWIGSLYVAVGIITLNIGIGILIFLFTFVWIVVRCAKGLKQLENNQPVKNLESWFFT